MSRFFAAFCLVIAAAISTGCTSVPMASKAQDTTAKTFAVKPDKASIYVYRNESLGAAVKMSVALDGKIVADTSAHSFMVLNVPPGKHMLVSMTENDSPLEIDAQAGRNYFVWQEAKMGFFGARSALHLVDDATGKKGVAECKLIKTHQ